MERAAGFLIVRESDFHVLCLRIYKSYDLPKGHIEDGETDLQAAYREAEEEANVKNVTFPWGEESITVIHPKKKKIVTLFLCTTEDNPSILPNPETGKFEHHAVSWLSLDEAEKRLHTYLRPTIAWVRKRLA